MKKTNISKFVAVGLCTVSYTHLQNPTLAPAIEKSDYAPKTPEADASVDADTVTDATAFLETFFKLYPTATEQELAYYVAGDVYKRQAYDVSKESLKNNIGLKFAFRSTDINEIKQTLEFFGIDKDDENNQKRLRDLENGHCLLPDLYGRVGVVQIHPVFEELLHALAVYKRQEDNKIKSLKEYGCNLNN